jgi:hypothetical protein
MYFNPNPKSGEPAIASLKNRTNWVRLIQKSLGPGGFHRVDSSFETENEKF